MQQALRAAAAIGDDRLQRMAHKRVQPETWTHGSSSERTSWLERGYERGTIEACDTFAVGADGPRREGTR
jgi:predicted metalloprotease